MSVLFYDSKTRKKFFFKIKFPTQIKYLPIKLSFKVEKLLVRLFVHDNLFFHINRHCLKWEVIPFFWQSLTKISKRFKNQSCPSLVEEGFEF